MSLRACRWQLIVSVAILLTFGLMAGCTVQRLVVLEVPPMPDGGRCVQVTQQFQLGSFDLHDLISPRGRDGG